MDEQPVIFDETFDAGFNERRRAIMPLGLKIYVWIGMVFGAFFSIASLFVFVGLGSVTTSISSSLALIAISLPFGIVVFMMTFLLWTEVKWAIRFNWVFGALWVLLVILGFVLTPAQSLRYVVSAILFAPYWIWLFRIRKRWENTSIRGREIKQ